MARRGWPVAVRSLPAVLHNRPQKIIILAERYVVRALDAGRTVAVAYADCGTYGALDELCARYGLRRLPGLHCYDVFAGASRMAAMFEAEPGTYVLTDFLLRGFDRLVLAELGLDRYPELWPDYFGHYRRLVWLAQEPTPALAAEAERVAGMFGLPLTRVDTGVTRLERRSGRAGLRGGPVSGVTEVLHGFLSRPRFEVIPAKGTEQAVAEWVPAGMTVTVTASPVKGLEPTIELAEKLAGRGYRVVPHLAARSVASDAHLAEIVERLRACGVDDVFVPGGDASHPAGPFEGALPLLERLAAMGNPFAPDRDHRVPGEPPQDPRRRHHPGHVGQAQVRDLHREQRVLRRGRAGPVDPADPGPRRHPAAVRGAGRAGRADSPAADGRGGRGVGIGPVHHPAPRLDPALLGPRRLQPGPAAGPRGPGDHRAGRGRGRTAPVHLQPAPAGRAVAAGRPGAHRNRQPTATGGMRVMTDIPATPATPARASAVIIGAGIVGNSLVHHLALLGWRDLVLVDKGPMPNPGGSTGHASNFIFPIEYSKMMFDLTTDSTEQYQDLGVFTQSGGIEVARTPERMIELRRRCSQAKSWGIPAEILSPGEVNKLVPYLDESVILGGAHFPPWAWSTRCGRAR